MGAAAVTTRVSGVAASRATGDGTGCAEGAGAAGCVGNAAAGVSAGGAMAMAAGTSVWVGVAPDNAVVSLLDGVELVRAPPDLCTTLGAEPDEETAAEADEFVDDVGSVDVVLAAVADDEPEADELSVGWDVVDVDGFGGAAVAVALTASDACLVAVATVVTTSGADVVLAVADVVEPVWARPVLTTTPGPARADADSEDVDLVLDGDPGADVIGRVGDPRDVRFGPDAEGSTKREVSVAESDPDDAGEEGEADDDELDVSAHATPCPVATAAPTPKATANPPTRPTHGAAFIDPLTER